MDRIEISGEAGVAAVIVDGAAIGAGWSFSGGGRRRCARVGAIVITGGTINLRVSHGGCKRRW
jgi:hypothetical protein